MMQTALDAFMPLKRIIDKLGLRTLVFYGVVGGLSAAINFIIFAILWDGLHIDYRFAVTASYFIAVLFNFTCNRSFTFQCGHGKLHKHAVKYISMIALNYFLTLLIMHLVVEILVLSPYLGLLSAIVITAFTGFILSKFWVFND